MATANVELGYWTCTQNTKMCGRLTPLQRLWLEKVATDHSEAATVAFACDRNKLLTECDLHELLNKLTNHATRWRDIGIRLAFRPGELDNIQARPFLQQTAPESWLGAMLTEWLQRAPDDT